MDAGADETRCGDRARLLPPVSTVGLRARQPAGAQGRVAAVHRQARPTLVLAALFAVAAGLAAPLPSRTGAWLPVHLFLVGAVVLAISAATQLLAVTWGAAPAPPGRAVATQRALMATGAAGLALAREVDAPTSVLATAGLAVIAGLALLAVLLWRIQRTAVQDRFAPVVHHYLVALAFGLVGSALGILLAAGAAPVSADRLRATHLTLNLLGFVGVVVAGTVPSFAATTAKMRVSPRATAIRQRAQLVVLSTATTAAAVGALTGSRPATGLGLAFYAVGLVGVVTLLPRLGAKQLRWAGPRLLQVVAGVIWLVATSAVAAADGWLSSRAVLVMVVGGYGQIVAGALAYLGPVLRGGGHERLAQGFRVTRSWLGLGAGMVAAVAAALAARELLGVAVAVWVADTGVRAIVLMRSDDCAAGARLAAGGPLTG